MKANRTALVANAVGVFLVGGVLAAGVFLAYSNVELREDLDTSQATAQKLYQQLINEGIAPDAPKPTAAAPGAQGEVGAAGRPPTTSEIASAVSSYCLLRQNCEGPTGPRSLVPGPKGDAAKDGATGKPGDAGAPGASGATGAAGKDGTNGSDGKDGAAGSPPFSWTYTTIRGNTYKCERTDPFDPASPTYNCAPLGVTP